ncbi:SDR family oxidoreductase [Paenibacillus crassostreae]|uniref:Short-chain dehydrogenase n=1 Tax=Paenibacillus crassostreae TaxID=1763538 RepID=A0A167FTF9_9BACL|nr:SDR family oxidoreductase [Paenibacillus crassostreae]AOZ94082.1 short-chain dehydrogenase [Paenibacillus crassostreae]OAB76882.1 short-chain dehydrogenase [Paenibacillus crassostreae]
MRILITGAGRGLGYALVCEALLRGHDVIAGIRDMERDKEHLLDLQSGKGSLSLIQLDVANENKIVQAKALVESEIDHIDVIINNAGILIARDKSIETLDFADMEQTMLTNVYGPMQMIKHFLPLLRVSKYPCIVNVSSEAGSFASAYGGDYPYAISKNALTFFTAQLKKSLIPDGFSVFAVHPGWIQTSMGGEQAPGNPEDTACGILDMIERKIKLPDDTWMVDHKGQPMPF